MSGEVPSNMNGKTNGSSTVHDSKVNLGFHLGETDTDIVTIPEQYATDAAHCHHNVIPSNIFDSYNSWNHVMFWCTNIPVYGYVYLKTERREKTFVSNWLSITAFFCQVKSTEKDL